MLILTREIDQSILIMNGTIRIMVLGIERGRVKLGIAAPEDVDIVRAELTGELDRKAMNKLLDEVMNAEEVNDEPTSSI